MVFQPLPHAFPFRFADGVVERTGPAEGRVRACMTANAQSVRGTGFPVAVLAELVAQSALLLQGGDAALGRKGFLAGLSDFSIERLPAAGPVRRATPSAKRNGNACGRGWKSTGFRPPSGARTRTGRSRTRTP